MGYGTGTIPHNLLFTKVHNPNTEPTSMAHSSWPPTLCQTDVWLDRFSAKKSLFNLFIITTICFAWFSNVIPFLKSPVQELSCGSLVFNRKRSQSCLIITWKLAKVGPKSPKVASQKDASKKRCNFEIPLKIFLFINPLAFLGGNSQEQRQKMTKITKIVLKNCLFYGVFSKTFLKTWRKMRRKTL